MTIPALFTPNTLATYLGVPVKTIYRWNTRGVGPKRCRVGKHVRYRPEDVEAWLIERRDATSALSVTDNSSS